MKKTDKINALNKEMNTLINEIIRVEKVVKGYSCISFSAKAEIEQIREEYTAKIVKVERQGKKPMSKTVLRVFDKNDGSSRRRNCYDNLYSSTRKQRIAYLYKKRYDFL